MIEIVDVQKIEHPHRPPVDKAELLLVGMFVRLLVTEDDVRPHRLWFKIVDATAVDYAVQYTGELVDDTHLDLELGHQLRFGPEHILEWSTTY